jgi:hypothetical protein
MKCGSAAFGLGEGSEPGATKPGPSIAGFSKLGAVKGKIVAIGFSADCSDAPGAMNGESVKTESCMLVNRSRPTADTLAMDQSLATLTRRLDSLERQNRRLRWAGVTALAAAAAFLLMGQASPTSGLVANHLVLRDPMGVDRIILSADYSSEGRYIPLIQLKDYAGNSRMWIQLSGDGEPSVSLFAPADESGSRAAAVYLRYDPATEAGQIRLASKDNATLLLTP